MTLKAFVTDSSLPQEDKDLWFSILENLDEAQIRIYENFVDNKEEDLRLLTENLKAKAKAIKNLDEKALEETIKQENV